MTNYASYLLDLDGTLIDSLSVWMNGIREIASKYELDIERGRINDRHIGMDTLFTRPQIQEVQEYVLQNSDQIALIPGAREFLEYLRFYNKQIALVTNSPHIVTTPVLSNLGILHHFDTVVGYEDAANIKPHPDLLLIAIERLGADATTTIMIGDSDNDTNAAKAAGIDSHKIDSKTKLIDIIK